MTNTKKAPALPEKFARFDNFEVHPCREEMDGIGNTYLEQCEPDDPALKLWSLYGHLREHYDPKTKVLTGGLECIADFGYRDREIAEYIRDLLIAQLPEAPNAPV